MERTLVVELSFEGFPKTQWPIPTKDWPAIPRVGDHMMLSDNSRAQVIDVVWQVPEDLSSQQRVVVICKMVPIGTKTSAT